MIKITLEFLAYLLIFTAIDYGRLNKITLFSKENFITWLLVTIAAIILKTTWHYL